MSDEKDDEMLPVAADRAPLNPEDDVSITFCANRAGDLIIEYRWKDNSQETAVLFITLLDAINTGKMAVETFQSLAQLGVENPQHATFVTAVLDGWAALAKHAIEERTARPVIKPSQVFKPKGQPKQ